MNKFEGWDQHDGCTSQCIHFGDLSDNECIGCIGLTTSTDPEREKAIDKFVSEDEAVSETRYSVHHAICVGLNNLYIRKNRDYGNSFGDGFREYGMIMPVIRLEDKFRRLKQLVVSGSQHVQDESIEDTLLDLANYAIMTVTEMRMKDDRH